MRFLCSAVLAASSILLPAPAVAFDYLCLYGDPAGPVYYSLFLRGGQRSNFRLDPGGFDRSSLGSDKAGVCYTHNPQGVAHMTEEACLDAAFAYSMGQSSEEVSFFVMEANCD
jgi:hypothetical protein